MWRRSTNWLRSALDSEGRSTRWPGIELPKRLPAGRNTLVARHVPELPVDVPGSGDVLKDARRDPPMRLQHADSVVERHGGVAFEEGDARLDLASLSSEDATRKPLVVGATDVPHAGFNSFQRRSAILILGFRKINRLQLPAILRT